MIIPDWLDDALFSPSPSVRLRAAAWVKSNPSALSINILMKVLQNEPVPQIRRIFNDVIDARQSVAPSTEGLVAAAVPQSSIPDLARLIRHELSPPVGWIRRAGTREIADFPRSATNDALNRLDRRIDALIALIKSDAALEPTECDLEKLLRDCWPDFTSPPVFTAAPDLAGRRAFIQTDVGLFELLLANAYQNAIDASVEVKNAPQIAISWSQVGGRFWVRITNAFAGSQFDIKDVEATGITTKVGHQGVGISLIKTAAVRMGYGFRVTGRSGSATFTLTGGVGLRE